MKSLVITVLSLSLVAVACNRGEKTAPATETAPAAAASSTQTAPPAPAAAPGIEVGDAMPEYSAMWLDGSRFDMASKRDKVVLLNLWATWCGPCRYEIPELQTLHDKYAPKGFEVIGVSVDETGIDSVKTFVAENKMTYPVALDEQGKLATLLETSVLPTSILVDRQGRIVWKHFGAIMPDDKQLLVAIEKSL